MRCLIDNINKFVVRCQPKSEDTSVRRKTSSSSEVIVQSSSKPVNFVNASSINTSLTLIPTFTRLRKNATGPTSPKGTPS